MSQNLKSLLSLQLCQFEQRKYSFTQETQNVAMNATPVHIFENI